MQRKALRRFGQQSGGFILVLALAFAALLGVASVLAIGPSVGEALRSGQELRDQRLFFLADGGATLCRGELKSRLNSALPTKLAALPPLTAGMLTNFKTTYVDGNDPAGFLGDYAYDAANAALLGGPWTKDSPTQAHVPPITYTPPGGGGQYRCTLTVTSRGAPVSSVSGLGSTALFRYRYTIAGTGTEGSVTRTVNLQGTFSVLVQQDNFARYVLFTNDQKMASGSPVYFGPGFNYYGPVRTNGQFNFMLNPSSHFWDTVESGSPTARYLNSPGSPIELAADRNGPIDVPIFEKGLSLGAAAIPMPTTTTADAQRSTALTGSSAPSSTGVYLGASGTAMTGGIYVKGDASISLATAGTRSAQYRITVGSTTWTVTADYDNKNTTLTQTAPTTYTGLPNGMLYVEGAVTGLAGTIQKDTQLTVAATNDVIITGNLMYENYTPGAPPSAEGTTNLLGVLSWTGSVRIGTAAPNDLTIHATLMAPTGEVVVDNFNTGSPRGTATVLGGVIENTYGGIGTTSAGVLLTGYARNLVYDKRRGQGMAPPFFPTTGKVISTLTGLTDRPNWQQLP